VLAGVGVAHLNPTAQFMFSSGAMPDGFTPAIGADVTSTIVSTTNGMTFGFGYRL